MPEFASRSTSTGRWIAPPGKFVTISAVGASAEDVEKQTGGKLVIHASQGGKALTERIGEPKRIGDVIVVAEGDGVVSLRPVSAIASRAGWVIDALGGVTAAARLLRVSKSQPSRWRSGEESPSPEKERELLDLDHVLARAQLLWGDPEVVVDWLTGSNAHLGGATPLDVIRIRGVNEVIDALDEEMSGAYA